MKTEIKNLWVRALTSGEFKQGKMFLSHSGMYCINGVLCALAMVYGHCDYKTNNAIGVFDGELFLPPQCVLEWAGLKEAQVVRLAELNDGTKNFTQLAEYIKEHV